MFLPIPLDKRVCDLLQFAHEGWFVVVVLGTSPPLALEAHTLVSPFLQAPKG